PQPTSDLVVPANPEARVQSSKGNSARLRNSEWNSKLKFVTTTSGRPSPLTSPTSTPMPARALPFLSYAISASNPASANVPSCLLNNRRLGEASRATNRSGQPSSSTSTATTHNALATKIS